jgi:hypothetical protein
MVRNITLTGATLVALLTGAIPLTGCDGVNPIGGGVGSNSTILTDIECNYSLDIKPNGEVGVAAKYAPDERWQEGYKPGAGTFEGDYQDLDGTIYVAPDSELEQNIFPVVSGTRWLLPNQDLTRDDSEYYDLDCGGQALGDVDNGILHEFGGVLVQYQQDNFDQPSDLLRVFVLAPSDWTGRDNCKEEPYYIENNCD